MVSSDYGKEAIFLDSASDRLQLRFTVDRFVPVHAPRCTGDVGRGSRRAIGPGAAKHAGRAPSDRGTIWRRFCEPPRLARVWIAGAEDAFARHPRRRRRAISGAIGRRRHSGRSTTSAMTSRRGSLCARRRAVRQGQGSARSNGRTANGMPESPAQLQIAKKQAEVWLKRFADEKLRELVREYGCRFPGQVQCRDRAMELRFSSSRSDERARCQDRRAPLLDEGVVEMVFLRILEKCQVSFCRLRSRPLFDSEGID